jgi:membrane protease YdiL (CAAX protease family)
MEADVAIILTTAGFIIFWFTGKSNQLLQSLIERYGTARGQCLHIYLKRFVGILCFGLIPALVLLNTAFFSWPDSSLQRFSWADYGVAATFSSESFYWTLGLSALLIFLTSRSALQPNNLAQYPEIRVLPWSRNLLIWSALSWIGYLIAYELLFRGFLLFSCVRAFGAISAVVINAAIYALVHVPKGAKEGIGAIPLGLLLCYITLETETIWVAVLVHIVLALSNEWFSLKYRLLEQSPGL